jgi:hypothetical protein
MGAKAMQMKSSNGALVQKKGKGVVQRYYESSGYRIADDNSVVADSKHNLYAKSGETQKANSKLAQQQSIIKLEQKNKIMHIKKGNKIISKLYKIEPTNKDDSSSGDNMTLYADCGKSNAQVMGNENRVAVHKDPENLAKTITSSGVGFFIKHKDSMKYAKGHPEGMKIEMIQRITYALYIESQDKKLKENIIQLYTNVETIHNEMKINISKSSFNSYLYDLKQLSEMYLSWYNQVQSSYNLDQELGINEYANPSVGQGYTISTGGQNIQNDTWNFHWAGVIMTSNDNKDKVVLENYAVGDPSKRNKKWKFRMHGTVKKGQSFHEQHKRTNQHGDSPTTMVVQ